VLSSSLHRLRLWAVMFPGVETAQSMPYLAVSGMQYLSAKHRLFYAAYAFVRCCMWRIVYLGVRCSPLLGSSVWLQCCL
jgi:hypothetical protein